MQTQGERANITQETIMVRDSAIHSTPLYRLYRPSEVIYRDKWLCSSERKNNLASQNRTHNYLYICLIIGVYLTNRQGLRLISTPSNTEAEAASA